LNNINKVGEQNIQKCKVLQDLNFFDEMCHLRNEVVEKKSSEKKERENKS